MVQRDALAEVKGPVVERFPIAEITVNKRKDPWLRSTHKLSLR